MWHNQASAHVDAEHLNSTWVLTSNTSTRFEHDVSLFTLVCACAKPASVTHITLSNFLNCSIGCSHATTSHLTRAQKPESTMLCTSTPYVCMSFHVAGLGDLTPQHIILITIFFLSLTFLWFSFCQCLASFRPSPACAATPLVLHAAVPVLPPTTRAAAIHISCALQAVSSGCGWFSACSWCGARCSVSGPNHDLEVWCGVCGKGGVGPKLFRKPCG